MKGLFPLFIGLFGTFAFSWVGLTLIPNFQIGHLEPQSDEEGTDIYPMPQSGMVARGRHVYAANGCVYCHSEQLRADYAASDLERKRDFGPTPRPAWGERRSAPRDYIFDRPVLLGKERIGPDLADIGKAAPVEEESAAPVVSPAPGVSPAAPAVSPAPGASPAAAPAGSPSSTAAPAGSPASTVAAAASPGTSPSPPATSNGEPPAYSAAWLHRYLYSPRSFSIDSDMPAYRFLYEKRHIDGERSNDALDLTGADAPPPGWEIIPTYNAKCLVAYLMSRNQSHPLKEVKTGAAPAAPKAASPAASPAGSPPPAAKAGKGAK
jgi:cbb3-type cytochrome oxidase cytochrome c subunit